MQNRHSVCVVYWCQLFFFSLRGFYLHQSFFFSISSTHNCSVGGEKSSTLKTNYCTFPSLIHHRSGYSTLLHKGWSHQALALWSPPKASNRMSCQCFHGSLHLCERVMWVTEETWVSSVLIQKNIHPSQQSERKSGDTPRIFQSFHQYRLVLWKCK